MQGPSTPRRWSGWWEVPEPTVAPAPRRLRPSKEHKGRRSKSQKAGGASIHKNVAYARSAAPRNPNRRRTGGYIGNKTPIVKARFFIEAPTLHLSFNPHFPVRETESCRSIACAGLLNEVSSLI